jgi:hypothetical protein
VGEQDLRLMRLIEMYLQSPFYGSCYIRDEVDERGHAVKHKLVRRLMRQTKLQVLYPRRRMSRPGKGPRFYPYLRGDLGNNHANQV